MRILHVWDQAGVSCLLALYQRKLGHVADIIMREEFSAGMMEYYGLTEKYFYMAEKIDKTTTKRKAYYKLPEPIRNYVRSIKRKLRSIRFHLKVREAAKNYDIVHIHSSWISLLFIPFKKKIIHWHGDDCRKQPSLKPRFKKWLTRLFILIYSRFHTMYVSTPDLLRDVPNAEWLPNPVDLDHFSNRTSFHPRTALYTHSWYESGDHAKFLAVLYGLNLTVLDRTIHTNWIPHKDFPVYLGKFDVFIDRKEIPSLSKTGLEALALGMVVVQGWDYKVIQGLDRKHHPEICAKRVIEIYEEILK